MVYRRLLTDGLMFYLLYVIYLYPDAIRQWSPLHYTDGWHRSVGFAHLHRPKFMWSLHGEPLWETCPRNYTWEDHCCFFLRAKGMSDMKYISRRRIRLKWNVCLSIYNFNSTVLRVELSSLWSDRNIQYIQHSYFQQAIIQSRIVCRCWLYDYCDLYLR